MPYFSDISQAINANLAALQATGALAARPGRVLDEDGYPTNLRAVVLLANPKSKPTKVPDHIGGFPVDVREATPAQQLQFTDPTTFTAQAAVTRPEVVPSDFPGQVALKPPVAGPITAATVPSSPYTAPAGATYDPLVLKGVKMICSVSPDNGWSVLEDFLNGTQHSLAAAMYDFTSAHIEETVATKLVGKPFELVLDNPSKNPTADQTDPETVKDLEKALGADFSQEWALTPRDPDGATKIFQTSYHIKVAVRDVETDDVAVWVSSGNWNNSNQPIFDYQKPDTALAKKSDRDWHVVVFNKDLAAWFKEFIDHDYQVAKTANDAAAGSQALPAPLPQPPPVTTEGFTSFVGPVTIQDDMTITPLLTPDPGVYVDAITNLIKGAKKTIDIQLQYVNSFAQAADAKFADLIDELAAAQERGVAIRMIFSEFQQEAILELMQEAKVAVDHDHVRIQNNVHNKGFLVDGILTVVSSQNWSGAGVLRNRDAGVIIENAQVNAYYQARFNYDWKYLATAKPRAAKSGSEE